MSIYEAILRAADHIERYPGAFDYGAVCIPYSTTDGAVACALGWIGHFLGRKDSEFPNTSSTLAIAKILKAGGRCHSECVFYYRMDEMVGDRWRTFPETCVRGLRLYARAYHAPLPVAVRDIFTPAPLTEEA